MSNERDELARLANGGLRNGVTTDDFLKCRLGNDSIGSYIADAILAAGYVKRPAPETEWGVGSKWGRHPFQTKADAEQNIALHHKCGEHARLVKRPAGTKPGQWEEAE